MAESLDDGDGEFADVYALDASTRERAATEVGRPGEVAQRATLDLVSAMVDWPDMLAAELTRASTASDVDAAVDRWADELRNDGATARVLYESGLRLEMAGRLMVFEIEVPDALTKRSRLARRAPGSTFLSLPFADAIEFFRGKAVMSPAEFVELQDRYRNAGFTATNLATEALRERARDAILHSLESGATLDETIALIRDGEAALGIEPATHGYLDTVVRTNTATAYGSGRLNAMTSESVLAARPLWIYYSARDTRVRASHLALDGHVFEAASDVAYYYSPPIAFRCRCSMSTLRLADLESRGLAITYERIPGIDPDEGFEGRPVPIS